MELGPAPSSSHTVQPQKHAVFLSFRGSDTRYNFVSHLYAALLRQGIPSFLDSEGLQKGREISEILGEIESSNVSIIIFSPNYANSPWCLDELVRIMECKKKEKQEIVPVFYHVDPSDVSLESKNGSYEVAIAELEKEPDNKVKSRDWKAALRQVANLSGQVLGKDSSEAQAIEDIVKGISIIFQSLYQIDFQGLVGIQHRIQQVESLLGVGEIGFRVIGICGMGGLGKTTLARALFEKHDSDFEGSCFLENVRQRSHSQGLEQLKEELLLDILDGKKYGSTNKMLKQLCHKKILVVLDDIDKPQQFEKIFENNKMNPESRVIATSRNKQVLRNIGAQEWMYEIEALEGEESLRLFMLHALKEDRQQEWHLRLSNQFANYVKGNPLGLKILGQHLQGKGEQEWRSALSKIMEGLDKELTEVLKISFDGLDYHEQQIFLDIACFFNRNPTSEVRRVLHAYYGSPLETCLSNLADKSLVTMSNPYVDMHDLLEEMGKEVVREGSRKEPGNRSRLWDHEDINRVLTNDAGSEAVEGILMVNYQKRLNLAPTVFTKMPKLKFLKFSPNPFYQLKQKLELPEGLEFLPKDELRQFHWSYYPLRSLPSEFVPEKLVTLNMSNSKVEQLWNGAWKFPNLYEIDMTNSKIKRLWTEVQDAPNLKIMKLSCCNDMIEMPDVSKAPELEKLLCYGCKNLEKVSPSISHLSKLEELDFDDCKKIRIFPSTMRMMGLKALPLRNCSNLIMFPDVSRNIERLDLKGADIKEIALKSFQELGCLKKLHLGGNKMLVSLPNSLDCLSSLQELNVSKSSIGVIPASIKQLSQLQKLNIRGCERLQCLPELPPSVCVLRAEGCKSLQNVSFSERYTPVEVSKRQKFAFIDGCKLDFRFTDCIELDESAREEIYAFVQRSIIEVVAPKFNKLVVEGQDYDRRELPVLFGGFSYFHLIDIPCSIQRPPADNSDGDSEDQNYDHRGQITSHCVVPGNEMPCWIQHQSGGGGGSSITIDFQPRNLLGFLFCAIFDFGEGCDLSDDKVEILFKVQLSSSYRSRSMDWMLFLEVESQVPHVLLCYAAYVPNMADSYLSTLSATMKVTYEKDNSWVAERKWGLSLIYKDGYDDQECRYDTATMDVGDMQGYSRPAGKVVDCKKYGVFLSFRGTYTLNTFISHLYESLRQQGIPAFIDSQDFEEGREFSKIADEIQEYDVSVVILSTNYADSPCCLEELVKIMECRKTHGQNVLPVFYRVDPSDVRNQTGSYGVAFEKHQENKKNTAEMLQSWRNALIEVAYISGPLVIDKSFEARAIKDVVKDISNILQPFYLYYFQDLFSIQQRIQQVESLLRIGRTDIRVIGIWGMGGLGKTTLAKALFNKYKSHFNGSCILEDVGELSNDCGRLNQHQPGLVSEMLNEFRDKKVLIVIDDNGNCPHFEAIIGDCKRYGPGSRIIITSRYKSWLRSRGHRLWLYEVPALSKKESLRLFMLYALKDGRQQKWHLDLSEEIVNSVKGNPLGLKILGRHLQGKGEQEWRSALRKIREGLDEELTNALKLSFDGLDFHEQQIFLDIACFFNRRPTSEVRRVLHAYYGSSLEAHLRNLADKSLVTMSNPAVDMHDLLEKIGKQVVHEESREEPGKRSRLWNRKDIYQVLTNNTGSEAVEGILMGREVLGSESMVEYLESLKLAPTLAPTVFAKMPNLKFLKFESFPPYKGFLELSKGLEVLPKDELRHFEWPSYPLRSLPSNFIPEKLVTLDMSNSEVEQLWNGVWKFPNLHKIIMCGSKTKQLWTGVQDMPNLKIMDLSWCKHMIKMPDLSKASKLEVLCCSHCENLEEVSPSISHLSNLEKLDFQACYKIKSFPSIDMPNLKIMDLSWCKHMIEMPDLSKAPKLEVLCCSHCENLEEVSPSISHLSNLEKLDLEACYKIRSFPITDMPNLKIMNLSWCKHMIEIPDLSKARKLEMLSGSDCENLKEVSASISHLSNLKFLDFRNCVKIRSFPSTVSLMSLKLLPLCGCSNLRMFPEVSTNIEELDLQGADIEEIPLGSFRELRYLIKLCLSDCKRLGSLPNCLGCLFSLQELDVTRSSIRDLPTNIRELPHLRKLIIEGCKRLERLPELPSSVRVLRAGGCKSLLNVSFSPSLTLFEVRERSKLTDRERLQFTDCVLGFSFADCIKLDKSAREEIFVFSQQSIATVVAPTPNKYLEGQNYKQWEVIVPGNEMPIWIEHRSDGGGGSLITIDFRPLNLLGFIFCAVFDFSKGCDVIDGEVEFLFEVKVRSNHWGRGIETTHRFGGWMGLCFEEVKLPHTFLGYAAYVPAKQFSEVSDPMDEDEDEEGSQYLKCLATVEVMNKKKRSCTGLVVEWGLSPIYKDGRDDYRQRGKRIASEENTNNDEEDHRDPGPSYTPHFRKAYEENAENDEEDHRDPGPPYIPLFFFAVFVFLSFKLRKIKI